MHRVGRVARHHWAKVAPAVAVVALALVWGRYPAGPVLGLLALLLGATVLAAVHHAEIVAHRVGEPFGSLVLAVAVTVIEVALILTLMLSGGEGTPSLARDTVFAAVMITLNGIVGLSLLISAKRFTFSTFNAEGSGGALATVITLAVTCLVLPTVTHGVTGPQFTTAQLAFAGVVSLALYGLFVITQTVRHRDFFLPVAAAAQQASAANRGALAEVEIDDLHLPAPSTRTALASFALLLLSLVGVVGLAKVESAPIETAVLAAGLPISFVGVIIALLVLLPETLAAVNNARRDRVQTSLNLALGSAMASVGLTIPTLAVASIWINTPLHLGLGTTQIVLLALTSVVAVLTVVPGRATRLQGGVHLVIFAAFVFLAAYP